ncbi:MAG TPA: bi-domain-containing oxidoreductase [Candidatus Sulfotelmatobacter sp.]|nr:bi-domain-containing oxidoreductase [Candidatus Sulfotelmatobacter sp.]
MKQVLQHVRTGEITVEDVPAPQLLPGCVLVRIAASVVSAGTERASSEFARKNLLQKAKSRPDLVRDVISKVQRDGIISAIHTVRTRLDQPQNPGYSSAGIVLAVGEGVTDLRPGDRVACAGGGIAVHAEIACVPRLLAARIPAGQSPTQRGVPFEEAAFATLGAVALHGIRTSGTRLGDQVAVIGLGLLGQLTVQLLKAAGCSVLGMDIDPSRADLALRMGADAISSSAAEFRDLCRERTNGFGADCVLITAETTSSDPVNLAGAIARDRGTVVAVGTVGMNIERKSFYEKEIDFRISRSYGPGRYDTVYEQKGRDYPIGYVRWTETRNMEAFVRFLAENKINLAPLITHRFPIERAQSAYDLITGRSGEPFLGVVIQYPEITDISNTLTLVPQPENTPRIKPQSVTVGLLGAGSFASSTLIPAMKFSPTTLLMAVCAATGSHAQHAAKKFGFKTCTTSEDELLQNSDVNTVVIATRHHLHANQVQSALAVGKNVFCEKPLCLTEAELRSIVRRYLQLEDSKRSILMVGFNRRFAAMTVQMKSFFASVSEPLALNYRINAGYIPLDHWVNDREQGGGRILGEVCHFIDLLMFLAFSPIVEVSARPLGTSGRYSGDNVLIALRFANGSEGTISYLANGDRSFSKERIEVFGGGSTAVLDDFRRMELVRNGRKKKVTAFWTQDKGHRAEWAAFSEAVLHSNSAPVSFEDIVGSTLATIRGDESIATGRAVPVDTLAFMEAARSQDPDLQ